MRACQWTLAPEMDREESDLLARLVGQSHLSGAHLEIGTGAGGTLCRMLGALPEGERPKFVVVDPMGYFPDQLRTIRRNLELRGLQGEVVDIRPVRSATAFAAARRAGESFDFILIDGRHTFLDVTRDLRWVSLLNVRGIVCLHDVAERFPAVSGTLERFLQRRQGDYELIASAGSLVALRKLRHAEYADPIGWARAALADVLSASGRTCRRAVRKLKKRFFRRSDEYLERYVRHEMRRLERGTPHQTLGPLAFDTGERDFEALINLGLQPYHRVADFGCGSLRLGRHLLNFLHPGHYWGLDITHEFFRRAIQDLQRAGQLDPSSIRCSIITGESLDQVKTWRPHLVLVAGVLQCVPPSMLGGVLLQIAGVCSEQTQILATLLEAQESLQLGSFSFRHGLEDLQRAANSAGLQIRVLRYGTEPELISGRLQDVTRERRATLLLLTLSHPGALQGVFPKDRLATLGHT